VGAPLGGFLADRWFRTRKNARMLFPCLSSLTTTLILLAAFSFVHGPLQYAVLLLSGVAAVAFVPPAVSVTQDVVHPGLRAVSLSTNVVIQHVLGSALGPPVVGALSDAFDIETALMFLPAFTLAAALLFLGGSFYVERDAAAVERIELKMEESK
jgi:MFS family permease